MELLLSNVKLLGLPSSSPVSEDAKLLKTRLNKEKQALERPNKRRRAAMDDDGSLSRPSTPTSSSRTHPCSHCKSKVPGPIPGAGKSGRIVYCPSCLREPDAMLGQRVIDALREPFRVKGQDVTVGASVGIAMFPAHGTSVDQLIEFADAALYFAKHAGRNVYRVFQVEEATGG